MHPECVNDMHKIAMTAESARIESPLISLHLQILSYAIFPIAIYLLSNSPRVYKNTPPPSTLVRESFAPVNPIYPIGSP